MLMVAVVALAALAAGLTGGRMRPLAELRLAGVAFLWAALTLQMLLLVAPGEPAGWRTVAYIASYPLGLAFAWANRRIAGVLVVAAGATLNLVAIVANRGVMPASRAALTAAGLVADPRLWTNSALLANPRVPFLGDVFATPAGWPFANVFSLGDVLVVIGVVIAILVVTGSRLVPTRWRRQQVAGT